MQDDGEEHDTAVKALDPPGGSVGWMTHDVPSQCSASVFSAPVDGSSSAIPTAVHAVADAQETPAKGLPSVPSLGEDWMAHRCPFQCSTSVSEPMPEMSASPTAVHFLAEVQETPSRPAPMAPAGSGKGSVAHRCPFHRSAGIELTVASQVIAPFLLTRLLLPPLRAAGRGPGGPARVIAVSSGSMYSQRLDPQTLQMPPSGYKGATAYARAKRAQVALSREWAGRLGSGQFWHDRRSRPEYLLPWSCESSPAIAGRLWECIAGPSGLDDPDSLGSPPPAPD